MRLCVLGVSALVRPDPRHLVQITPSALGLKTGAKSVSHLFSSLPLRAEVDAPVHWRGMGAPSRGSGEGKGANVLPASHHTVVTVVFLPMKMLGVTF